jgi:hypothetical protein
MLEAAESLRQNRRNFAEQVKSAMRGGTINGFKFENVLK